MAAIAKASIDARIRGIRSGIEIVEEDGRKFILIHGKGSQPYDIPMASLATHENVLAWTLHLSKKGWMTPRRLQVFIETVASANGWQYLGAR